MSKLHYGWPFRTFNSYSLNFNDYVTTLLAFVHGVHQAQRRAISVIFEKIMFAISLHSSPFWYKQTFVCLFLKKKSEKT